MKEETINFRCDADGCNKSEVKEGGHFPYEKSWVYLYALNFKAKPKIISEQKDKHFCSVKCALNFISKKLVEAAE